MVSLAAAMILAPQMYLATYFLDNGQDGIYLAASEDGYVFKPIIEPNVPILRPPDRMLTRDACLMLGPDGVWHMVWTVQWWNTSIGIAHSRDLTTWEQTSVRLMDQFPGAINAWAPEITFDPALGRYVIFWSSTVRDLYPETARTDGDLGLQNVPLNHRFYFTTTTDFKTYTPTALLWNPGFNCIDATLVPTNEGWIMFGKDETKAPSPHKFLFVAKAPSATGPFRMISPKITGSYWAEGPTAIRVGDTFRVFFDRYSENRFGAVESEDLHHWRDVSDRVRFPQGARHGTVIPVSRELVEGVRSRLKSR